MHRRLLPIVSPCHEDWDEMHAASPGDAVRRCYSCHTAVVDLSVLSEPQARLVLATPGEMCIRYRSDDEGRIQFRRRARRGVEVAALVSLLTLAATSHADTTLPSGASNPDNAVAGKGERPPKKTPKPPKPPPKPDFDEVMGKRSAD